MRALLTDDHRNLEKSNLAASKIFGKNISWTACFSRRARNAIFTYEAEEVCNLFFPLQYSAYEIVFIHASLQLYESSTSLDFLARAMNAVSPTGALCLDAAVMSEVAGRGRVTVDMVRQHLGVPDQIIDGFWLYRGREIRLPEDLSILGWYYNQRGVIVETNVTGGTIVGKSPSAAEAILGRLLYPGDSIDTFPKRLPRKALVDIVDQVRSGKLAAGVPANVPELERVAYNWNWDSHGAKFRQYQESWENYLIPGSIYKAGAIASIVRRLFPGRENLSFLEHGGNAGLLTAQLLLDFPDQFSFGVCCEIDIVPLLNALNVYHYFPDRLIGRMFVRNGSADSLQYDRKYSVVAFVHMLLYVRRDLLPSVLRSAWSAVEPGGILLVFENTSPPSAMTGVDSDIIFSRDELEAYLKPYGEIEFAEAGTGMPATQKDGLARPLLRYVKKAG